MTLTTVIFATTRLQAIIQKQKRSWKCFVLYCNSDVKEVSQPDAEFEPSTSGTQLFSQSELNNLMRDLNLPKDAVELLGLEDYQKRICLFLALYFLGIVTEKKTLYHILLKIMI